MDNQKLQKRIPYTEIRRIIVDCPNPRTQALLAFDYGFGCRAGELAREYMHFHQKLLDKKTKKRAPRVFMYASKGSQAKDLELRTNKFGQTELTFIKRNFKQKGIFDKEGKRSDIAKYESFVNEFWEPWLYEILVKWVTNKKLDSDLFDLKESRIRYYINTELRKYNPKYSTHWLRHSRGYDIAELTQDPYAVQAVLGHGDIRTSMHYVNRMSASLYKVMEGGKRFEDVLGRTVVGKIKEGVSNG